MELGGNAHLDFEDADLDLAADIVTGVKFSNAGQMCVARIEFRFGKSIETLLKSCFSCKSHKVGFDKYAEIETGPVIDERAFTRIKKLIDGAVADGATLLCGDRHQILKMDTLLHRRFLLMSQK